jgi:hypothetical protein
LTAKFYPDRMAITVGASEKLSPEDAAAGLARHLNGDWGDVDAHDREQNDAALHFGGRLMGQYQDPKGTTFWIITEADRSVTTVLLPEDY